MRESIKRIDARGLACPEPVVATKKALDEGGFETLEVLVDGSTAKENVSRFAAHAGHTVEAIAGEGGSSTIRIRPRASASRASANAHAVIPAATSAAALGDAVVSTVFISSDRIGSGDDELGALLMRGFIKTLLEAPSLPERIILMNGGVRLAVEGSSSLERRADLAALGDDLMACGTCLDFYRIKDKLAVGRISNMFEISGLLLGGQTLSL